MTVHYHKGDLPSGIDFGASVAVDTETMGLNPHRDRLCVVQLSAGDGDAHVVQMIPGADCPNLKAVLGDTGVLKIFHFARFDVAMVRHYLGVACAPVYCTKIVSKLVRTNTDRHGLKYLCADLVGVDLSKQQQSSDWGTLDDLTPQQLDYAASDVLYLHQLKDKLDALLDREGRRHLAEACFRFLPARAELDLLGWDEEDIFSH